MEHNFKPWQPVVVRMKDDGRWEADFFCRYQEGKERCYLGTSGYEWKYCLPAEGNEPLVGTKDDPTPPEPEFNFGDMVEVRDKGDKEWRKARFMYKNECESISLQYVVFFEDNQDVDMFAYCRHVKKEV